MFQQLNAEEGITIILVTHDPKAAAFAHPNDPHRRRSGRRRLQSGHLDARELVGFEPLGTSRGLPFGSSPATLVPTPGLPFGPTAATRTVPCAAWPASAR